MARLRRRRRRATRSAARLARSAGVGASTVDRRRTLADFAADTRHFCDSRGLGRPAVVGNSQGARFALACAVGGVASAVAVVSGADEVAAAEFVGTLPAEARDLVDRAVHDPAGAEEFFAGFTAEAMRDMVLANSPECDLVVYRDPTFAAAYRRALAEGFANDAAGYARDAVLAMRRWRLRLDEIAVPVDLWYGERDTTHSTDNGATLTRRVRGARRHVVPGAGGSLLWTHAGPTLTVLLERMAGDIAR